MPLPSTRFRALRSYEADPNYANSQYGELLVSERTPVLSLSPAVPISTLRNTVDALSGAEIEREDSEYRLRTAANGGSSLTLDSAQRGQYVPGYTAQAGLGVRIPSAPTGNQRIEWGYMDDVMNVSVGTSLTPLMTFRRKSALAVIGIGVEGFDIITTGNIMVALHSKATLGGTPAFSALADVPPSETALEVDTSATSVTGGVMLHTSLAVAGGGTGNGASLRRAGEPLLLPAGDLSFSARAISGTSSVTLVVRMLEGW